MGALAAEESLFSAVLASCATPAASTLIRCQKIALWGGRLAASFRMSSNDSRSYHLSSTRPLSGASSRSSSSCQNISLGETPFTIAIIFVQGNTCRIVSKAGGKIMSNGRDGVVLGQLVVLDPTCLHGGKHHRCLGKKARAIPLDEIRCWRADGDDEIGRVFRIKRAKIIDERCVRFVVIQPGSQKRVVMKIYRGFRLPAHFRPKGLRVIGPWLEAKTERMQHQYAFGLYICCRTVGRRHQADHYGNQDARHGRKSEHQNELRNTHYRSSSQNFHGTSYWLVGLIDRLERQVQSRLFRVPPIPRYQRASIGGQGRTTSPCETRAPFERLIHIIVAWSTDGTPWCTGRVRPVLLSETGFCPCQIRTSFSWSTMTPAC